MKILVIRFSSIGDIVLTTPVIRCLKTQLPGVEIHYLTKPAYQQLLSSNPYIHTVHTLENSLDKTVAKLKAEQFDHLVDLHHNLRTGMIKLKLRVKSHSFNKLNFEKWLLVAFKINILPLVHIVDRYLETVKFLGIVNDQLGLEYYFSNEYAISDLLPLSHRDRYTAIAIGGQHFTKRLPVHKLVEICRLIEGPVVLLGGKEDAGNGEEIRSAVGGDKTVDTCGKLTLDQSAFLTKHASRLITNDTGLMHIAAAFNKPITSVWGNTVPGFGMVPYKVTDLKLIENKQLWCRPCSKIGYSKCPLGHFRCMNDLDERTIAEA